MESDLDTQEFYTQIAKSEKTLHAIVDMLADYKFVEQINIPVPAIEHMIGLRHPTNAADGTKEYLRLINRFAWHLGHQ